MEVMYNAWLETSIGQDQRKLKDYIFRYLVELGGNLIIGSGIFNNMVIVALCICCIPAGEIRKICSCLPQHHLLLLDILHLAPDHPLHLLSSEDRSLEGCSNSWLPSNSLDDA